MASPSQNSGKLSETAMSQLTKYGLRVFAAFIILAVVFSSRIVGSVQRSSKNSFDSTRNVLSSFYPELFGQKRYLNVSTGCPVDSDHWAHFVGFRFTVSRFAPGDSFDPKYDQRTGGWLQEPENTIFLEGQAAAYEDELSTFVASGELAHTHQLKNLQELVKLHPQWSDDQAIQALKDAGGRYGPGEKDELLHSLHLGEKLKFLGVVRIKSVEFENLPLERVGSFTSGAFEWLIEVEAIRGDNSHATFTLWFEPFGGKLIQLHRNGAPVA